MLWVWLHHGFHTGVSANVPAGWLWVWPYPYLFFFLKFQNSVSKHSWRMARKIKTLPLGKVWVTPHPSHDYGTYSFLSKQEFCNWFTFRHVDKNMPCFVKTCSVCAERKLCFFGWVEGRKCVLCEREQTAIVITRPLFLCLWPKKITVKISNKLKDLATFCVHMYVQVCVVGGGGVHTDLDMTYYILCVSCYFFQTCCILVCPNSLCECYIILCYVCECYMLIRTCPACICGANCLKTENL